MRMIGFEDSSVAARFVEEGSRSRRRVVMVAEFEDWEE